MAIQRFVAALTPAAIATISAAEQAFTVGPGGYDISNGVVIVAKPTTQVGLILGTARISSATQISIVFANPTAGSLTPTAGEQYQFVVIT